MIQKEGGVLAGRRGCALLTQHREHPFPTVGPPALTQRPSPGGGLPVPGGPSASSKSVGLV